VHVERWRWGEERAKGVPDGGYLYRSVLWNLCGTPLRPSRWFCYNTSTSTAPPLCRKAWRAFRRFF